MKEFVREIQNKQNILAILFIGLLILPGCPVFAAGDFWTNPDFTKMLFALEANSGPVMQLLIAVSYVIGFAFIVSAILELKQWGQSRTMMSMNLTIAGPLTKLLIGVVLFYLPTTINVAIWTIWGHGAGEKALTEFAANPGDKFGPLKRGSVALVRVVGYASFIRGFVMLSRVAHQGSQPGVAGKAIVHIIGGIFAINIWETIQVVRNSLFPTI